jgi:hypothetical protein
MLLTPVHVIVFFAAPALLRRIRAKEKDGHMPVLTAYYANSCLKKQGFFHIFRINMTAKPDRWCIGRHRGNFPLPTD